MPAPHLPCRTALLGLSLLAHASLPAADTVHDRIRAELDAIPAIDCHEHLHPFSYLIDTVTLPKVWQGYTAQLANIAPQEHEAASAWWTRVGPKFENIRATGFYRYLLPAFRDLYGVDFDRITPEQIEPLDAQIRAHYHDPRWLYHVVTERANIELMLVDPNWARLDFTTAYPFQVLVFNVTPLLSGFNRSQSRVPTDDPYRFAQEQNMPVNTLDDYVAVLDRLCAVAKEKGAASLKTTRAYDRTLRFENVPKGKAVAIFGRKPSELTPEEVKEFEDYIMWRLAELSAKYDLPFQIHTGHGQLQGSNPILLLNLIQANPKTKFVIFHGGYPWVGETGAIGLRHWRNVWLDTVWLPTISPTMARRALHEWLETVPSDHILWGGDSPTAEAIYGSTVVARVVLADVLAETVERGELTEAQALRIGRQIMRDNALALFPSLKSRLWKQNGPLSPQVEVSRD